MSLCAATVSTALDKLTLVDGEIAIPAKTQLERFTLDVTRSRDEKTGSLALYSLAAYLAAIPAEKLDEDCRQVAYQHLFFPPKQCQGRNSLLQKTIREGLKVHWRRESANFWHILALNKATLKDAKEGYLQFLVESANEPTFLSSAWKQLFEKALRKNREIRFLQKCGKYALSNQQVAILSQTIQSVMQGASEETQKRCRRITESLSRMKQLAAIPESDSGFQHVDALRLALFMQMIMIDQLPLGTTYFKKDVTLTARTIICDTIGNYVLCSKSKVALLAKKQGEYKKYRSGLQLSPVSQLPGRRIAHSVNKTQADFDTTYQEMRIAYLLRGKPCIAQLLGHQIHNKLLPSGEYEKKLDLFWEYYEGDLTQITNGPLKVAHTTRIELAKDILTGLYEMHKLNIIHGDLKLTNILFSRSLNRFFAFLTDFGFSFVMGRQHPTFIFKDGFYGSICYTAPELFGNLDFKGDYFLVEAFAVGVVLYQFYFKKDLPWAAFQNACYDQKTAITNEQKEDFRQQVETTIEPVYTRYTQQPPKTVGDRFFFLLLKLLRADPQKRMNIPQALEEITKFTTIH